MCSGSSSVAVMVGLGRPNDNVCCTTGGEGVGSIETCAGALDSDEITCPLDLNDENGSDCCAKTGGLIVVVWTGAAAGMLRNAGSTGGSCLLGCCCC